jgi:hypothetical protein
VQKDALPFVPLHWLTAGLYLATGAGAMQPPPSVEAQRTGDGTARTLAAARWAPAIVAPLAGTAHALRATRPGPESRWAARLLNAAAVGAAAYAVGTTLYHTLRPGRALGWQERRRGTTPAWLHVAAPLAFGATGLLGLFLEREEARDAAERRRLARKASLLERLAPRRFRPSRIVLRD